MEEPSPPKGNEFIGLTGDRRVGDVLAGLDQERRCIPDRLDPGFPDYMRITFPEGS